MRLRIRTYVEPPRRTWPNPGLSTGRRASYGGLVRRAVGMTLLLGLVAASSAAAAQPRFTRCAATTLTQQGSGEGVFVGSCGGRATSLKVGPGSVTGRLGGLPTTL